VALEVPLAKLFYDGEDVPPLPNLPGPAAFSSGFFFSSGTVYRLILT